MGRGIRERAPRIGRKTRASFDARDRGTHSLELRQALVDTRSTVEQHITRANALKERLD